MMSWLRLTTTSNCFLHPYLTCKKWLGTLICCPLVYGSSLTQLYPPYLALIVGYMVTCWVKMMWLCHGSNADSHLKLLPTWILDTNKVYEHIDMLSMSIQYQPYTVIPTLLLGLEFGVLGHLWSQKWCDYHGWGWQPPLTASHIHIRHIKSVWAVWYAVHVHKISAIHISSHPTWHRFWGSGSLVESKWFHYVMVEADSHLKLHPTSILDIYKVFDQIDIMSIGIQ